jgi:nucleoid-associated protein YgaU
MASSRYTYTPRISTGTGIGQWTGSRKVFEAVESGALDTTQVVLTQGQRLDHLAGQFYGDGRYWWVIAAASGIGWALQCPAGTIVRVPKDLARALIVGR